MSEQTTTPAGDDRPQYPTASCASCFAPIIWATTTNGANIPVDAEPVDVNGGHGSVLLYPRPAGVLAEVVVDKARLFGKRWVYRPHMETCPFAERYRGRARQRRPGHRRGWARP